MALPLGRLAWDRDLTAPAARGFLNDSEGTSFENNLARDNGGHGFQDTSGSTPDGPNVYSGNVAQENALDGFRIGGFRAQVRGNTAVDNGGDGFFILTDDEDGVDGVGFAKNSSYGNTRCGLLNASGGPLTTEKTWWGTPEPVGAGSPTVGFEFCVSGGGSVLPDPSPRPHRPKVKGDL